jgi:hypothetical protein
LTADFIQFGPDFFGMGAIHMDFIYVGLMVAFFALSAALVYGLDKLRGPK